MVKSLHTTAYADLIALLAAARIKQNRTQQAVADRLGKPQSYVAKVEGGERRIDVVEFIALARAMDCDPQALFSEFLKKSPVE